MSTLHVIQSSGEAFDSSAQATRDFDHVLFLGADAIGFTEVSKKGHRPELLAACKRHNYILQGGEGDTAVAVSRQHRFIRGGSKLACTGGKDEYGAYGPRYVDWATFEAYGETVTVTEAHWPRPKNAERVAKHKAVTAAVIKLAQEKSTGTALAFILGDVNENLSGAAGIAERAFANARITHIYDLLRTYPDTGPGGGTIDLIASVNADARVKAVGLHVVGGLNTDHKTVSGFYTVRP
jgi:hypothetical protein